jgi:hypothetical protein
MGRSFKQRKLKKTRRVKIQRFSPGDKKSGKKKLMKSWEWWLLGVALVFALGYIIFLGKSGSMNPAPVTTPTAAVTPATP